MENLIDRMARKLVHRRNTRRDFLSNSTKVVAGLAVGAATLAITSEEAKAICDCNGCYTVHGTSGSATTIGAPLNFRYGPYICSGIAYTMTNCNYSIPRNGYTNDGDLACNCCGYCSTKWYRNAWDNTWFSSVWTAQNDGNCGDCCDALLEAEGGVG